MRTLRFFVMDFPFRVARRSHADDRNGFRPETGEHRGDELIAEQTHGAKTRPAIPCRVTRYDHGVVPIKQLGVCEIEAVRRPIRVALGFVPDDLQDLIVYTK